MEQVIKMRGSFTLVARDPEGRIKEVRYTENLVVDLGLAYLAGSLSGYHTTPSNMKYVGVGTGTTTVTQTDSALETEVETRATGTASRITTDTANDTYQTVGTLSITGTHAITEAAVFDGSTAGSILCRQTFSAINLNSGDSLQITYKTDFDAA